MSDQKRSSNCDDYPLYFVIIWIPFMVILIATIGNNDDPNSLLTDEQKLEKQKEIELKKEQDKIKSEQDSKWWNDQINYFIQEKPMPYTFIIGLVIFGLLIRGYNRRRHYDWFTHIFTPSVTLPLCLLLLYIAWVSGFIGGTVN